jgi:hypothetical protein
MNMALKSVQWHNCNQGTRGGRGGSERGMNRGRGGRGQNQGIRGGQYNNPRGSFNSRGGGQNGVRGGYNQNRESNF